MSGGSGDDRQAARARLRSRAAREGGAWSRATIGSKPGPRPRNHRRPCMRRRLHVCVQGRRPADRSHFIGESALRI
eukprot:3928113-Prymnesium_polylepis.1